MGTCWQTSARPANTTDHRLYANRPGCPVGHHNTVGAHRMGCRCPEAKEAVRIADKRRRCGYGPPRSYTALGTTRRLGALMAAGHTATAIAAALHTDPETIRNTARGQRQRVFAATAVAVAHLYAQWRDTPGPSKITATRAKRAGHVEPIWWDDDTIDDPTGRPAQTGPVELDVVVVDRLIAGHTPLSAATRAERVEAVRRLLARGMGTAAISRHLRTSGQVAKQLVAAARRTGEVAA